MRKLTNHCPHRPKRRPRHLEIVFTLLAAGVLALGLSGCGNASPALADVAVEPAADAAAAPAGRHVPAGTVLRIELEEGLRSHAVEPGQSFRARLHQHLVLDGEIVLPEGAAVVGRIVEVHQPEAAGQRPTLTLAFDSVRPLFGQAHDIGDAALVGRLSGLPQGVTVVAENTLAGPPLVERRKAANVALANYLIANEPRNDSLVVPAGSVFALTLAKPIDLETETSETEPAEPVA